MYNEQREISNKRTGLEIAVIGIACRFPGANNIDEFWENLKEGKESLSFLSDEELTDPGSGAVLSNDPNYINAQGGILENKELFDASFFDYTPREAELMDPQTCILHECCWTALEDAGYDSTSYKGAIGLYAGNSTNFVWEALSILKGKKDELGHFAADHLINRDFFATRVSYNLNLKGPSVVVLTTCSTSLVAIHLACRSLLTGDCKIALAGGVTISHNKEKGYIYRENLINSPDGHCRAFDANAKGTVFSSGAGIVVLKSLQDAVDDRDHIYAVVKGSAVNNDGDRKVGYTAPSVKGQAEVIRAALRISQVESESVTYVETHGTGTPLGDPIEIQSLIKAFGTKKRGYCAVGTVKTNLGHLDSAAGAAGFIKTVLALKNRQIPASLHFRIPNPNIDFNNSPFYVNQTPKEWKMKAFPLRAGVSSFGLGGTNAHIILEESFDHYHNSRGNAGRKAGHAAGDACLQARESQLILLSAKTGTALEKIKWNLAEFLKKDKDICMADVAYTLNTGRRDLNHRFRIVCRNAREAITYLSDPDIEPPTFFSEGKKKPIIFMFSGQGSQYVNMGLGLYREESIFRTEVDRCFDIAKKIMEYDAKSILYPDSAASQAKDKIFDVLFSGVVKFAFEYSLAKLLMKWGIKPYAMIGHSFGEYTAACLAGVFSLEDALRLVILRGRSMWKTPAGIMMSVPLPEEELSQSLGDDISLAAVNTASLCIVSGAEGAVENLEERLNKEGHECVRLKFPKASHSRMMLPIKNEFEENFSRIRTGHPSIPYISGLTGNWITVQEAADPAYWGRHLIETVRFSDGITRIVKDEPEAIFVQVGSDRGLTLFVRQNPGISSENVVLNMVRHAKEKVPDQFYLLDKIGQLWLNGQPIDWNEFYGKESRSRVSLPTYPFESQRYWLEGDLYRIGTDLLSNSFLYQKQDLADWFYIPAWKPGILNISESEDLDLRNDSCFLVFLDEPGVGLKLIKFLEQYGVQVIRVKIGIEFEKLNNTEYLIDPQNESHYCRVIDDLSEAGLIPVIIFHLWSVTNEKENKSIDMRVSEAQNLGLNSLCFLAQAVGKQNFPDNHTLRIIAISNNMQRVQGEELLYPEKITILAPVKVIPQEFSNIKCCSIDICLYEPGSRLEKQLIKQVEDEFINGFPDQVVAFRCSDRLIPGYEPVRLEHKDQEMLPITKGGVYLITGGLGGIGFELAKYFARAWDSKLALVGRSFLPQKKDWLTWLAEHKDDETSNKIKKVQELEELGVKVIAFSVDISNVEQMREVVGRTEKELGQIKGIIHSAGIPGGGVIQFINKTDLESALQSKLKGTLVLEEVFKEKELDFFVMCSSANSIIPTFGQVDYCAANLFQDAYAHYQNFKQRRLTVSINWDRWQNTGMAVTVEAKHKELTGEELGGGMKVEEAIEAFTRAICLKQPQVIVSVKDFNRLVKNLEVTEVKNPDIDGQLPGISSSPASSVHKRPLLSSEYIAPKSKIEKKLVAIFQKLLGFEVGVLDDFFELGGDSLRATILISRIQQEFKVKIPLPVIFKSPTILEISENIKSENPKETKLNHIEHAERKEYYATSSSQKRLFFLEKQMRENNTSNNVLTILELDGFLDIEILTKSLIVMIQRHESLRTAFKIIKKENVQEIVPFPEIEFKLEYFESSLEESRVIVGNFTRPFDLSRAPLLKVGVIKLEESGYVLIIDMHHIIVDNLSMEIFIRELITLYKGAEFPPLKLRYKDYSEWQTKLFLSEEIKKQERYWLDVFKGEIPSLNLKTDFERPAVQSYKGDWVFLAIEDKLSERVFEQIKAVKTTSFVFLFAVFNVLLMKYTGREDVVVGTPVEGRRIPGLQEIIGMFSNTVALRNFPLGEKPFIEFVKEVNQRTLEAFENQDYPFDRLIQKVLDNRNPGRSPLFDIAFEFHKESGKTGEEGIPGLQFKPYKYKNTRIEHDLILHIYENGRSLKIGLQYASMLFENSTAEKITGHYIEILNQLEKNMEIKLADILISHGLLAAPINASLEYKDEFNF